jgi:anaerobic magnesium-protoporphyrin IX monomethyl ester cyclase
MKKVLLVGIFDTNTAMLAPEMLRSYVSQFPIAAQYDIRTLNLSIFSQSVDEMIAAIKREDAAITGFSAYIWNIEPIRKIVGRVPGTIIVGGPQCNEDAETLLAENPAIDIVVSGEGEETFKELLEHFAGERGLESISGITTARGKTAPRAALLALDSIASPYPRIFREQPAIDWIAYETSRGCPFLCGFCTWGYSKKMRYHELDRVFSDLDVLLSQPSLKRIYLCDSSILLEKDRAKRILRHIIARNRDMVLRYEFNAEHLDDEIIDLLLQLPENEFNFGVQTINPPALKIMRRPFKRKKFEENYWKMARRVERTSITMDVIYGLPGDDLEGFKESLNYTMSFDGVKWILTNPLILLPGSDYYRDAEKHGIKLRDRETGVVESTSSFPVEQMREAIKISFWVSTVFFNARLRDAMRAFAVSRGIRFVDVVIGMFSSLPFALLESEAYPYMVPSAAKDFRDRNLAVFRVARLYAGIVKYFDEYSRGAHRAALADFEDHFSDQFRRLKHFAIEEAARCGVSGPAGIAR